MNRKKTSLRIMIAFVYLLCMPFLGQTAVAKKVLNIQHWTTQKGIPVYFVQTQQVPMLVLEVGFDGGSGRDAELPGTAALLNALLNDGNAGLTETQMAEGFENVGAIYNHSIVKDMAVFRLQTVTDDAKLNTALAYFTKIFQPDFPQPAFEREKKLQKIAIQRQEESPDIVAAKALFASLYPNHPYGKPVLGFEDSVDKIQLQHVKDFYQQYYTAPNAVVSMAGAIDLNKAKKIAEEVTQAIPLGQKAAPLPKAIPLAQAIQKNIPYNSTQTTIDIGQVAITYDDPDYYPLMVGNYTLGGGVLVSQLGEEIRKKRGLAYDVRSTFNPMVADGPFVITLASRTEKAPEALKITQQTLARFLKEGPSISELNDAKRFLKGNFPLRFETNGAIADTLLLMGIYHWSLDRLDKYISHVIAVTPQQIKAAFQKRIHPDRMVTVTVGKNG